MSYSGLTPNLLSAAGRSYPNPFYDISSTYIPPTLKLLFQMCRYMYYSNGTISPIIYKLSEYPVTNIVYEKPKGGEKVTDATKELWKKLLEEHLHIKRTQIEINLDYHVYGNAFISLSFPFSRQLECPACKKKTAISKFQWGKGSLEWKRMTFLGKCPKCKREEQTFKVVDIPVRNRSRVKIIRWCPMHIDIKYNPLTGHSTYIYHIMGQERKKIQVGDPETLETTPWVFIDAVKNNRDVQLEDSNLFHFKRPCISDEDMGWGMPLILPAIKDAYYSQIMKKGQEAVMQEHIVPMRVLYPTETGTVSPFVSANLGTWRAKVEDELRKWRQDPNYVSIMPLPVGVENIGGDAKALLITPELQFNRQLVAESVGVPLEFLAGGLTYSGGSVSLRILENHFLTTFEFHNEFLRWMVTKLSRHLKLPEIRCRQSKFKMADDMQAKQIILQLQQLGKVSPTTLLNELDLNFNEEQQQLKEDNQLTNMIMGMTGIQNAESQGQMGLIAAKYQALAQVEAQRIMMEAQQAGVVPPPPEAGAPGGGPPGAGGKPKGGAKQPSSKPQPSGGPPQAESDPAGQQQANPMTIPEMVATYGDQLMAMPPEQAEALLRQMEAGQGAMPELAKALRNHMAKAKKVAGGGDATGAVDMRPLPEQKPPRRQSLQA